MTKSNYVCQHLAELLVTKALLSDFSSFTFEARIIPCRTNDSMAECGQVDRLDVYGSIAIPAKASPPRVIHVCTGSLATARKSLACEAKAHLHLSVY